MAATTLAAAVAVSIGAPESRAQSSCPSGKVLAESRHVTLVKDGRRLVACMNRRPPYEVAVRDEPAGERWSKPFARGRMVAFQLTSPRTRSFYVTVVDVKRRQRCYLSSAGTGRVPEGDDDDFGEPIGGLVLRRSGAFAYIAGPGVGPTAAGNFPDLPAWAGYEVMVVDRHGARQVGAGPDIEPGSLAITGDSVTWRQGDSTMSAPFAYRPRCNA